MKTEILSGLTTALHAVARAQKIEEGQLTLPLELGRCKNPAHGDYTSNVAMQYAKTFQMKKRSSLPCPRTPASPPSKSPDPASSTSA